MLDAMRKHSQSFLIYLIFGAIIVVFAVNFGPGSSGCSGGTAADFAAKVNGEVIPRRDFVMRLDRQRDAMRRSARASGSDFTDEMFRQLGLREQILDALIEQRLLAQEGKKRGLLVSDEDLLEYLEENLGLDELSFADYQGWVNRQYQTTVAKFEQQIRDDIVAERMRRIVSESISVSDSELRETFARENNRAMVTFVRFDVEPDGTTSPTADEIAAVLEEEKEAIEKKYETEKFSYRTPKRIRARQIFKALPADASDADVAKARGQLLELKEQIEGGADFAALAKSHTEDEVGKETGGEMGWLERGETDRTIIDAIFDLKTDEIVAEPVKTDEGMHLIQVTEIEPPALRELADVQEEVAKTLLEERAADAEAEARAKGLLEKLQAGDSLEDLTITVEEKRELEDASEGAEAVTDLRPVRKETPWILESRDVLPLIGSSKELHDEIFNQLSTDAPIASRPYKVGNAWFVVVLEDRELPDFSKFDDAKDSLRTQAISVKSSKVYRAWIDHLRKESVILLNPELFPAEESA